MDNCGGFTRASLTCFYSSSCFTTGREACGCTITHSRRLRWGRGAAFIRDGVSPPPPDGNFVISTRRADSCVHICTTLTTNNCADLCNRRMSPPRRGYKLCASFCAHTCTQPRAIRYGNRTLVPAGCNREPGASGGRDVQASPPQPVQLFTVPAVSPGPLSVS